MSDETKQKLSHRKWRQQQKKLKRKLKRQENARQNEDQKEPSEEEEDVNIYEDAREKSLRLLAEEQWLERERLAQMEFTEKKRKAELEKKKREEEEQRIKQEWEEREKREQEEEKKRQEVVKKRKERQERLLREATANENKPGEGGAWSNPLAPRQLPGVERKIDKCPFFTKTAACRFGDRCSRLHDVPDTSLTIVFPGMYNHYSLDQALRGEYDIDIDLEYEDSETTKHFEEFYHDVLPEFRTAGTVVQFKVCRNFEPHLKGNVYVQYTTEEEALRAYALFNARWYGGKQLSGRFANITSWRQAICGQYHLKKCIKGRGCNFLHVFINPNREFRDADTDYGQRTDKVRIHTSTRHDRSERSERNDRYDRSDRSERNDRNGRSPSRSMSRSTWRRSRSRDRRSRSRDRNRRSRSRERTRSRLRSRSRSRDRTRSRARSKSRERRTSRQRSRDRKLDNSRDKSVSKSRQTRRSRSRSKEKRPRSRSRSPKRKRTKKRSSSKSPMKS